jgi:hypothetical protein
VAGALIPDAITIDGKVYSVRTDRERGLALGLERGGSRRVGRLRQGPRGVRPQVRRRGLAAHGYPNVPPYPASHGCVRVTNAAADWLWANGGVDIGRPVHVY